jgi:uncharacterized protein YuzE
MPLSGSSMPGSVRDVGDEQRQHQSLVTVSYDSEVDCAYIRLAERDAGGVETVGVKIGDRDLNIDVDRDGRLVGLELFDASTFLPDNFAR